MEEQQNLWQFMREQSAKAMGTNHYTYWSHIYIPADCCCYWFAIGHLDCSSKKSSRFCTGFCRYFTNHSQHCLTWFYDPFVRHWSIASYYALFLYALLPIIRNTYTGINEVDASVIEAAKGMGMSR